MHHKLARTRNLLILGAGICWLPATAASETGPDGRTFVESLRAAGWQVEMLVDGSLQLMPVARSPEEDLEEQGESEPPTGPDPAGAEDTQPGWAALRERGWRVETDAEGATLLYPPAPAATPAPTPSQSPTASPVAPEVADVAPNQAAARDEVARDLDALLAERGWRAERESDGTLVLFPLRRVEARPNPVEPAAGVVPSAITELEVSLPIDTWGKAQAVAASWLESVGDSGLQVGKIREIFRIYLVSIVETEPPNALRHQISIGVEDGRVVVLN